MVCFRDVWKIREGSPCNSYWHLCWFKLLETPNAKHEERAGPELHPVLLRLGHLPHSVQDGTLGHRAGSGSSEAEQNFWQFHRDGKTEIRVQTPLRFVYHNSSYLCPCSILAQLFGFSYVWWFQIVQLKNFNVLEDRQWLSSVTKILKQCDTQHSQALNKIPNGNVLKQTKWASGLMFQFSARILEEGKGTRHLQDKKSIRPERKVFI